MTTRLIVVATEMYHYERCWLIPSGDLQPQVSIDSTRGSGTSLRPASLIFAERCLFHRLWWSSRLEEKWLEIGMRRTKRSTNLVGDRHCWSSVKLDRTRWYTSDHRWCLGQCSTDPWPWYPIVERSKRDMDWIYSRNNSAENWGRVQLTA